MSPARPAAALLLSLLVSAAIAAAAAEHGDGAGGGFLAGMPWFGGQPGGAGGWGAGGYGGPGYARRGMVPPSTVCMEKGPCYKKKLTCPAKCFRSFSYKGKHGGGGGGGGGCSFDCTHRCEGYC